MSFQNINVLKRKKKKKNRRDSETWNPLSSHVSLHCVYPLSIRWHFMNTLIIFPTHTESLLEPVFISIIGPHTPVLLCSAPRWQSPPSFCILLQASIWPPSWSCFFSHHCNLFFFLCRQVWKTPSVPILRSREGIISPGTIIFQLQISNTPSAKEVPKNFFFLLILEFNFHKVPPQSK